MASSDSLSSAEVASSSRSNGASFRKARAIAMRWRCPPDSFTPRLPTMVAKPRGRASMNSRHHRNGCPQAFLRDPCDVLSIDRDAAVVKIIEALDQREQARLASSRRADEADALARLKRQAQAFENGMSIPITK